MALVLAASLALGILAFLILYVFVTTQIIPKNKMQQRLRDIQQTAPVKPMDDLRTGNLADIPLLERTLFPFFRSLADKMAQFAPQGIKARLEHRIMLAGKQGVWSVSAFALGWIVSIAICFLLIFIIVADSAMPVVQRLSLMAMGAGIGALIPFSLLNSIIRKRQKLILRQLPEFLDLLCVSVQAGLSFDGGVTKITARMQGPFIDECIRMQRDVRMGMTRARSLRQMAQRCDVQEVYLFTTAVIQAERLGTSMATTLVNQADNMRERRRQAAKAEALKAPVKIVFPLVLFIFPALFVIVLLPSLLFLMKNL